MGRRIGSCTLALGLAALSGCTLATTWVRPHPALSEELWPAVRGATHTLLLIGDAGLAETPGEPVLAALGREAARAPERTSVVFLGDNVYPDGVPSSPPSARRRALRRLEAQVEAVPRGVARVVFIPGNHDYHEPLENQRRALAALGRPGVELLPARGCVGPEVLELAPGGPRLVILDTEQWLSRRAPGDPECPVVEDDAVRGRLLKVLSSGGPAVVVGHHPVASHGPHGGSYGWKLWNLPRRLGFLRQDLSSPRYRKMRRLLEDVLRDHPPVAYVSGHEHSLQVLDRGAGLVAVVSGAGTLGRTSGVTKGKDTLLASPRAGFVRLDFFRTAPPRLTVVEVGRDPAHTERRWSLELGALETR